ncbi:hypothetical protein PLICRDRAFT_49632 [Plicaturopsis crispa FD-325 SS-3]|nr:hypothetical protein PLICRDRAFT_49632 [Plicaturopsis crispa FD-325 SS-3]
MSTTSKGPPPGPQPLIHEKYIDVPSQRLYYLSLGLLCQAIKIFDFFQYLFTSNDITTHYGTKWAFVDFAYCVILTQLRIPRLNYTKSVVVLQIAALWFFDGLLFGGISLNMARGGGASSGLFGFSSRPRLPSTPEPFSLSSLFSSSGKDDAHLLGQHTVRMSPISTAQLNPDAQTFCLAPPHNTILVPILLNNTNIASIRYSLIPLGYVQGESSGKIETVELSAKDLRAIEQARIDSLQLVKSTPAKAAQDEYYEDDEDDEEDEDTAARGDSALQKTQSLVHIKLTRPGTLRLDRVMDASGIAARAAYPAQVTVVPCPGAHFHDDKNSGGGGGGGVEPDVRCAGPDVNLDLRISIGGVPPLSLRWYKEVEGKREYFLVEGIEGDYSHQHNQGRSERGGTTGVFERLDVPLAVSLDALGKHAYVLEEVTDGVGNAVRLSSDLTANANSGTVRALTVLRRPAVSFRHCGPGTPTSLLIGSEAPLTVSANEADALDAPWEVTVGYQPPSDNTKRYKPWKKVLGTQKGRKDLTVRASAPGEYTVLGVKGKYCEGDVLAPETCKVVERPLPTAEIEWKRIHECSGDTGVSATLVLHGTPPFHVTYLTQRDTSPARARSQTFASSRGEFSVQPDRSGHYVYTFTHVSDAHYQRVALGGPTIEQVVHPLATAEFGRGGRGGRVISSCEGGVVDVDVELKGTGPWNLEVQVVGPHSTETLQIPGITTPQKTLQIPIPKIIDQEGGSFEVELVSIEDSYGCKRPVTVPGISVNVRRVKPTAKFYGKDTNRYVTVLEREPASLPLRLTGEGPWHIKYRRAEAPDRILTAILKTPNDRLQVRDKGLYEILEVMDSQCPGSVIADEATYQVNWVPKPSAKLSSRTESNYEAYNGSHILPAICEGVADHVDLELSGRPPFQIMYNIAQDNGQGGTTVLDQPTFSSIQPHTRFQLHTTAAGRKYYEVKQIGDAAYPLAQHPNTVIPRAERLLFEQQVLPRPSAGFKNRNRLAHCLYDALTPRDVFSADGVVQLEGTPPFVLRISIKNLAASEVRQHAIKVTGRSWRVDLPEYSFMSIGPHVITIDSVEDASGCEQAVLDPGYKSIWVDVAETAAIVPFDRRQDYCVGDVSQFQLEGTPPWTISYRINSRTYTQDAKVSPFSLVQQQAGEFAITSVAHQQKMCKAAVADLRFAVHALPAAKVGKGSRIEQDIHEGDQAEIVFTLIGEPPFTFTYQRSEPSVRKNGPPGKVLETHTVSGVTAKQYSIYSALEGTWTVTSISDRYCRYPPAQPDGVVEKSGR